MADEKEEREKTKNGDFCSGISRLHEKLGELRGSCAIHNEVKLICLNCTLLYVLRALSLYYRPTCSYIPYFNFVMNRVL